MDSRGGCCIARYAGGGAYDMSKVDRIMMKFRPIAPKPAAGGSSGSGGSSTSENNDKHVKTVRGKRKYVRSNKRCNNTKKRKASSTETDPHSKTSSGGSVSGGEELVTLSLLPETPERKDSPARKFPDLTVGGKQGKGNNSNNSPIWLNLDKQTISESHVTDQTVVVMPQPAVKVVGSFVTVECVTDTWVDGNGIGCTDEERMMTLDGDTCPGFVSDRGNRVWWTNKAYREMAGQVAGEELMVWVVMKEWVTMPATYPAFTCKVRVTCGKERRSPPLTVPCDVWRLENGGYAWRLDIKAALCLGR